MNTSIDSPPATGLMRERAGLWPNTAALGYASLGHLAGLAMLCSGNAAAFIAGVLLTAHTMVISAYLIHESAHYTLFRNPRHNRWAGEAMAWICGAAYASYERIRHMHLRHHRDRADVTVFDYKALLRRFPKLRATVYFLERLYVPAVEILMHGQLIVRPFVWPEERDRRLRVALVLGTRLALFALLAWQSWWALAGFALAYWMLLTTLNFFDAFHHTFEQYFTSDEHAAVPMEGRDRDYEQAHTYSNVVSVSHPVLNLLTLNFGYHNAHHERASVPWYRLPALHRDLFGGDARSLMPLAELLVAFHRHRVRRVLDDGYGSVGEGAGRADGFVGAHGVSFLTVV